MIRAGECRHVILAPPPIIELALNVSCSLAKLVIIFLMPRICCFVMYVKGMTSKGHLKNGTYPCSVNLICTCEVQSCVTTAVILSFSQVVLHVHKIFIVCSRFSLLKNMTYNSCKAACAAVLDRQLGVFSDSFDASFDASFEWLFACVLAMHVISKL